MLNDALSIEVEGQSVSLGDLAGLSTDEISEYRRIKLVTGFYVFKVDKAELGAMGDPAKPAAKFNLDVIGLIAGDFGDKPEDFIGVKQSHNIILNTEYLTLEKWVGLIKSFMADSGYEASGDLQAILAGFSGHTFIARVIRKADRNDKDVFYSNLDIENIKPLTDEKRAELGL